MTCKTMVPFVFLASLVVAKADSVNVEADLGVYSEYIWHGIVFDNRPVVQGSATVTHETGFYLTAWWNYSTSAESIGESGLNELDYTLGFAGTYAVIDYDLGYSYFTFPTTQWDEYQEIYVGVALNNWVITPSLYAYYDIMRDTDTLYFVADLNYGKALCDTVSVEVGSSLGWGNGNYHEFWVGKKTDGVSDLNVYTGLSYALSEDLSLNGKINYSLFPDGTLADATEDHFWGSLNLVYRF